MQNDAQHHGNCPDEIQAVVSFLCIHANSDPYWRIV